MNPGTQHEYRFKLFPLGVLTQLFEPEELRETIRAGAADGFRLLRREFSIEPRRILFVLAALGFGLVFRRTKGEEEPEHDWKIAIYKTRLLTKTVDPEEMQRIINAHARGGFELHFAIKFPTRLLFIFPRESYVFIFRKPIAGETKRYSYRVSQTAYNFFTRTIDPVKYEADLNALGAAGGQLKVSMRDERRVFGILVQPTALAIFETQD